MATFLSLYSTRLTRELAADSTVLFTTKRRQDAVNEGLQEFADLTECFERTSTVTITGGTAEYDLNSTAVIPPGDFARVASKQVQVKYVDASSIVTWVSGDDLPQTTIEELNRFTPGWQDSTVASTTMQLPTHYYLRPDGERQLLGFYPVPSTGSSATMTAVVPYVAYPAPLTSDTQEPFATASGYRIDLRPYHQALVHYAASQLEKFRPDVQASQVQLQLFMGYVQRFMAAHRRKNTKTVTPTAGYFRSRTAVNAEDPRR